MRKGITVAGTILADIVKMIDAYPEKGMLTNISSVLRSVGGCVPNTGIDLARLGGVPIYGMGRVGKDETGRWLIGKLQSEGIDTAGILETAGADTSFTDVMTVKSTGERTFFNTRGANALFSGEDILAAEPTEIVHIAYLLLLDSLDAPDETYGTRLAAVLAELQKRGVKTSIDVVSDTSDRFKRVVSPALKYCDYAILNELEAGFVAGVAPRDESGKLIKANIRKILESFCAMGVAHVVVHCPEGGFSLSKGGYTEVPSLLLPKGYIKGSVGAGDAFCAGMLYGLYTNMGDAAALDLAACAAAANLSAPDSIGGARSLEDTLALGKQFGRRTDF